MPELEVIDPHVHDRRWLILGVLCMSLLIIVIDNTILNVAIPSLIRDLDASNSQIQWIIDGYVLVFAGLLLTAGSLSDRFGRKGALQLGLVLFALGSMASATADTAEQLIFTRAFMGIGAALIMPSTLSILINVFHDPKERGRAIADLGRVLRSRRRHRPDGRRVPARALLVARGVLGQHSRGGDGAPGRRASIIPKSRDPEQSRLDPVGAVLSIVGLATLLFGIIEGPEKGWSSDMVIGAFVIAGVTLVSFVLWERHSSSPMLDMSLFANPRFTAASSTITLVFFALFGSLFLMTQYWQLVHGYTPLEAGVRLLPHAATMMIVAPLSARVVEYVGTKRVVLAGLTLIMVSLGLLSTIEPDSSYPLVISYFMLMAAGMGMTMAPATESVMGSVPRDKAGVGSAVNDTTRQVGGALGVAIIGSAVSSVYVSRIANLASDAGLDPQATSAAEASLGGAQRVGAELGDQGAAFVASANQIFVDSMAIGMRVSLLVVGIALVMAWKFLPARATLPAATPDDAASEPDFDEVHPSNQPASVAVAPPATATLTVK